MKKGFTLAEVLITLTIIGVVASLTIPTLINNIGDQHNKVAWRKIFSDLSQAGKRLAFDNGGDLAGLLGNSATDDNTMRDYLALYMNYVKKCDSGKTVTDGCWHASSNFYKLSGQAFPTDYNQFASFILNNGAFIRSNFISPNCTSTSVASANSCGEITIDVNGFKGPNMVGKDIYAVVLLKNGIISPRGTQGDVWFNNPADFACDLTDTDTEGWNCSALYLYQ